MLVKSLSSSDKPDLLTQSMEALGDIFQNSNDTIGEGNPYFIRLKQCGGLSVIINLQCHPDHAVYRRVAHFIDQYLPM